MHTVCLERVPVLSSQHKTLRCGALCTSLAVLCSVSCLVAVAQCLQDPSRIPVVRVTSCIMAYLLHH